MPLASMTTLSTRPVTSLPALGRSRGGGDNALVVVHGDALEAGELGERRGRSSSRPTMSRVTPMASTCLPVIVLPIRLGRAGEFVDALEDLHALGDDLHLVQGFELRHLGHEVGILLRLQRVLVPHLGDDQLHEVDLAEVVRWAVVFGV